MNREEIKRVILERLTDDQKRAVKSGKRRILVVAGAGSGKTEVMARRIAWWVAVEGVSKDQIVAFTFTERAAAEMKFRIRSWIENTTPKGEDVTLGNMYVGTIHGFCLAKIREYWADEYHNYDILDEAARTALILRGFHSLLGLSSLKSALNLGQYATLEAFTTAYDQLHEHNRFKVKLASEQPPYNLGPEETEWCKRAKLLTDVGDSEAAEAFGHSAARYYAYLRCRHFLDFSTSQTEFIGRLAADAETRGRMAAQAVHLVVDEAQDINPVQRELMELLVGDRGRLTAVGDHRQSIYGFRGAKVDIIAELWEQFMDAGDADVVDLQENFRSTPRIIELANRWADTISRLRTMKTPPMKHGRKTRKDHHRSHVAIVEFAEREQEADWIGDAVRLLVPTEREGAEHDKKDGAYRGLSYSDIAVLVRSSTDVRTYMKALESAGIPSIVRAGPDLFSQPEVLFFVAALALTAGVLEFYGSPINPKSLPNRIREVLDCEPKPENVLKESAKALRNSGLKLDRASEERVLLAGRSIHSRISEGKTFDTRALASIRTPKLRDFLSSRDQLRRVFPQQLFHFLLSEAGVHMWDTGETRGQTALFHLGALSGLITGIEVPGWTSARDYHWQMLGLCQYGAEEGRAEEQPLMVRPDAVTISTIHGVKGLEFSAIFLADVCARRFPSGFARKELTLPLSGEIVDQIDVEGLRDNINYDGERRLMYVALTRAERFLFVSHSGKSTSRFIKELKPLVEGTGGMVTGNAREILQGLKYLPKEYRRDIRLSTSFSDLRYYLECAHDFYLRKVLGFSPTIDQAFGYGRGVHNLLRAVHTNPRKWAALASDRSKLEREIQKLIDRGLFYLRYTTGQPADNMRSKGLSVVADYVARYAEELQLSSFEPEKSFETLIEYPDGDGGALVSGSIDLIRQIDPPRASLIDFKSGEPGSDGRKLDEEEMKLQVAIYGIAAKTELEYEPDQGLVRYLGAEEGDERELRVPLDREAIGQARHLVARMTANIRDRIFHTGPRADRDSPRCGHCDFVGFCGLGEAIAYRSGKSPI